MAQTKEANSPASTYQGISTTKIFDMYNKIKDKVPGLKEVVNANIKGNSNEGNPNLAYDKILQAYSNYMAVQKGEEGKKQATGPGFVTGLLSSLETLISAPFYSIAEGIQGLAQGFYETAQPIAKKSNVLPPPKKEYKAPPKPSTEKPALPKAA